MELNKIHQIDVLRGLKKIPDNSIDCIVTSPPYWALRDYGVEGQIGLEENPQQYIDNITELMKECKRIIKPTGTIWLNIGDSYYSKNTRLNGKIRAKDDSNWLRTKQKLLTPYRIAIQCQDQLGLILRNDINWIKQVWNVRTKESQGSSMPSSVVDRLNTTSESIFFFVKDQKYYFDIDNIRIPHKTSSLKREKFRSKMKCNPRGKNPGDCIIFPLEPSREKHYAMFPKSLPEFCIRAGCPEQVCKKCGMPRLTIKVGGNPHSFNFRVRDVQKKRIKDNSRKASKKEVENYNEKEYLSKEKEKIILSCNCKAGFTSGVVLDPFMGSGTTAIVSKRLGRRFIGFEINPDYIKIANRRLQENEK